MAITTSSQPLQVSTPNVGDASDAAPYDKAFGTIEQLPLEIQVGFQQKLLAILALQLAAVFAVAALFEWDGSILESIQTEILENILAVFLLIFGVVLLLVVLHNVRNKYPLNWIMLALFSCAQVLGLLCLDVALDSHIAVVNCAFVWLVMAFMALLTRWTKPATAETSRALRSPYLLGWIALVGAIAIVAIVGVTVDWVFKDEYEIAISAVVQVAVMVWFCKEVKAMHQKLSPDEYMRGVIYFYTDLLVLLAVTAACAVGGGEAALLATAGTNGSAEEEA